MKKLFGHLLDFLFPPSPETLDLRALSTGEIFEKLPPALSLPYSFITPLFSYKFPLTTELIKSIKRRKDVHAFELGGFALYSRLPKSPAVLVPIPLSKKRRRQRGYNQCELLIEEILKLDSEKKFSKEFDLLSRAKDSGQQKLKGRSARFKSSEKMFMVNKTSTSFDMPIILIDDVATTGSTLHEAREALLQAGFKDVRAFTLAH